MSKKVRPSTNQPLRNVRILVGRARHQASALSAELRSLGAQVLEIPFIEIRQPRSYQPLDSALKNLTDYDWLILTSVNGVEAMWARMDKLKLLGMKAGASSGLDAGMFREGHEFTRADTHTKSGAALAAGVRRLRVAAIGPATKKAIEQRAMKVDVVPKEYVAESVVRSLRRRVNGKRVLLVRAKVARDVIPRELRKAGARVDVVEAYETVAPQSSRARLRAVLKNPRQRPHVVTFTSSSTVRNFVTLLGGSRAHTSLRGISNASIGPVTSSTLRELRLRVDIEAKKFTIPGLVEAIMRAICARAESMT
ncbi:MAG: uroporphyrinogen-III synthase [Candidatus Sulfotelmatobacter sp.]